MILRSSFLGLLACLSMYLAWVSAKAANTVRVPTPNTRGMFTLPDGPMLQVVALGYEGFFSSLVWVQCIFDLAEQVTGEGNGSALSRLLSRVISLDPRWKYPYEFGGLVLESEGKPSDQAIEILRKGIDRFPQEWRMRVYLAQALRERGHKIGEIIPILAPISEGRCPSPDYVRGVALALLEEERSPTELVEYLVRIFPAIDDPMVLAQMTQRMTRSIRPWLAGTDLDPLEVSSILVGLLREGGENGRKLASRLLMDLSTVGESRYNAVHALQAIEKVPKASRS